jgi:YVTN family beta-propeller protein
MTVVDTKTNEVAWTLPMNPSPSPMAVSKNADGSTRAVYAQNGRDNGFQVVDFATRKVTSTIKLPNITDNAQNPYGPPAASHGIMVTPDQKTLLVNSRFNSAVYSYSLPDLKYLGVATLGGKGAGWLTITPDSKTAYIANEHTNDVSVVDIKTMKETTRVPVGFAPARNIVWMAP